MTGADRDGRAIISQTERVSAPNYAPLPVVISRGEGVWVWDVAGRQYLDCVSAYSSLNQGHRHPRIVRALIEQAERLTLTSRAVHNDRMGPFLEKLCRIAGFEMALPERVAHHQHRFLERERFFDEVERAHLDGAHG